MKLLVAYLRPHWKLVLLALLLATVNQVFSLLDPLIFRHVIDEYATRLDQYTTREFLRGVSQWLLAAVGVAFVSRVAKNFQDYFLNVVSQRIGARLYADGIRHALELPYQLFEDQRSGETLGKLQKVRSDVEKLMAVSINVVFQTLVGVVFVVIYAFSVHWLIAPVYFATIPLLGWLSSVLSRRIKAVQKTIVAETTALAGATTESLRNIELVKSMGLGAQEIARLNATTGRILGLELKKVRYLRSLSFVQGTTVNALRTGILFLMLYLIFAREITVGQFFALWIYSFFIFGPLQELGSVIGVYRETEVSLANFQALLDAPREPRPEHPVAVSDLRQLAFERRHVQAPDGGVARRAGRELRAAARRDRGARGSLGRRQDDARQAAGRALPPARRTDPLRRDAARPHRPRGAARADRLRDAGHAALLRLDPREPAVRPPRRDRRRVPGGAGAGGLPAAAGSARSAVSTR